MVPNPPLANSLRFCRRFGAIHRRQGLEYESASCCVSRMTASHSVLPVLHPSTDCLTLHLSHHGPSCQPRGYKPPQVPQNLSATSTSFPVSSWRDTPKSRMGLSLRL